MPRRHRGAHPVLRPHELLAAPEHLLGGAPRDDHDAVQIRHHDVTEAHPHAADRHRLAPVGDAPARHRILGRPVAHEGREPHAHDRGGVARRAVDHGAAHLARAEPRRAELAEVRRDVVVRGQHQDRFRRHRAEHAQEAPQGSDRARAVSPLYDRPRAVNA